jgi:HlyD family secretion protein
VPIVHAVKAPTPIRDTAGQDTPLAPRGRRRRWIIGFLIAAAVLAGAAVLVIRWLASDRSVDADRLQIATVTRGTLVRDAAVTGRVVAAVSPTLYAPVPGTVTLQIRAGDTVKKGDVLAKLDSPELTSELHREQSTLQELEAQRGGAKINSREAKLAAKREADEAEIAYLTATRELEGAERAWQLGAIAEDEYNRAKDAVKTATVRREHTRAAAGLAGAGAGFDLKSAEQQYERQRLAVENLQRRVDELQIRSPVDGVVGTLAVADRAVVPANTPLMTVVDLSQLEVELEVPETYADDLGIGMTAEIKVGTGTVTGTLSALSPEVVNNQVTARVRFTGAQPAGLRQSQRVSARILIEERPDVVMVQRGPFVEAHAGRYAYVIDGDIAVRRPIRLGAVSVTAVEVLEGLVAGDRVVIAGSEDFEDAGRVQINQ